MFENLLDPPDRSEIPVIENNGEVKLLAEAEGGRLESHSGLRVLFLSGKATEDGRLYHGRILDYLRGMGLEQNAVISVIRPDGHNAWVNIGYAGFIGSVTAMNEHGLAIGEMGGSSPGHWDGLPMAQLVREVMEQCETIDEAVALMRETPRTCEYYYVISDGKSNRAVGIRATPDAFETVWPGEAHELLPHPVADAVLLSQGDRYDKLVRRVKNDYGSFDSEQAWQLMDRPVAMGSNIQTRHPGVQPAKFEGLRLPCRVHAQRPDADANGSLPPLFFRADSKAPRFQASGVSNPHKLMRPLEIRVDFDRKRRFIPHDAKASRTQARETHSHKRRLESARFRQMETVLHRKGSRPGSIVTPGALKLPQGRATVGRAKIRADRIRLLAERGFQNPRRLRPGFRLLFPGSEVRPHILRMSIH